MPREAWCLHCTDEFNRGGWDPCWEKGAKPMLGRRRSYMWHRILRQRCLSHFHSTGIGSSVYDSRGIRVAWLLRPSDGYRLQRVFKRPSDEITLNGEASVQSHASSLWSCSPKTSNHRLS